MCFCGPDVCILLLLNLLKSLRNIRNMEVLERATGIEPVSLAWKAKVLPLHNARAVKSDSILIQQAQGAFMGCPAARSDPAQQFC